MRTIQSLPFILLLVLFSCTSKDADSEAVDKNTNTDNMKKEKVLFVLTSHDQLGDTGKKTGYYVGEAAHPWKKLMEAGYEVDFVSPKGGKAPVDDFSLDDPINKEFWENEKYRAKVENTMKPSEVNPSDYVAIHYVGGHGTMWDFPEATDIANIAMEIYENGGVISAVCHGPAGIINLKNSDGSYLIDGKKVSGFTNEEEEKVGLTDVVPFLLEDTLKARGGKYEKSGIWEKHAVADGRLVTGQNPQSATLVGEKLVKVLQQETVAN